MVLRDVLEHTLRRMQNTAVAADEGASAACFVERQCRYVSDNVAVVRAAGTHARCRRLTYKMLSGVSRCVSWLVNSATLIDGKMKQPSPTVVGDCLAKGHRCTVDQINST